MPSPEGKPLPSMTFEHVRSIPLRVGMLKTLEAEGVKSSDSFTVSPHAALEQYLHARFVPKGFDGTLQATIEDASVRHTYEPSTDTVKNYLNLDGRDVYDMTILLRLEHHDRDGTLSYGTVITVRRLVKVSEHASIAQRERAQYEGMEELFKDLDRETLRVVLADMGLGLGSR